MNRYNKMFFGQLWDISMQFTKFVKNFFQKLVRYFLYIWCKIMRNVAIYTDFIRTTNVTLRSWGVAILSGISVKLIDARRVMKYIA